MNVQGTSLRERNRIATRDAILDAAADVLRAGTATFSMERVAERAGVSPRTVYRYFADREDLLQSAAERLDAEFPYRPPTNPEDIADVFERLLPAFETERDLVRAGLLARISGETTWRGRGARVEEIEAALEDALRDVPAARARQAKAVVGYLANSLAWLALTEEGGLTARDAGRAVGWAIRALVTDLRRTGRAR